MAQRLKTAIRELRQADAFDHVIVNDDLGTAVAAVHGIMEAPDAAARAAAETQRINALIAELTQKTKEIS